MWVLAPYSQCLLKCEKEYFTREYFAKVHKYILQQNKSIKKIYFSQQQICKNKPNIKSLQNMELCEVLQKYTFEAPETRFLRAIKELMMIIIMSLHYVKLHVKKNGCCLISQSLEFTNLCAISMHVLPCKIYSRFCMVTHARK